MPRRPTPTTTSSIEPVLRWLDDPLTRSTLGDTTRTGKTSLRRLAACRRPDEPDTLEWLDEHLGELAERLRERERLSTSAVRTYAQRAESVLISYQAFLEDPTGWVPVDRRMRGEEPPDQSRTPEQELTELWQALAKWPHVRRAMYPMIEKLVRELEEDGG